MGYLAQTMTPLRETPRWAKAPHSIDNSWAYGSLNDHVTGPPNNNIAWPTTNLIIYVPVVVKQRINVKKMGFGSGTTGTGNIAIGVYSRTGARLINSGTIAKGTTNVLQVVDTTDTALKPDLYYIALQSSNNTDTFTRTTVSAPLLASGGTRSEAAGGFGLPATATWIVANALTFSPIVAILTETTLT